VLLVFVDDATSPLVACLFCEAEATFEYMEATQASNLLEYGKPVAFYSDNTLSSETRQRNARRRA